MVSPVDIVDGEVIQMYEGENNQPEMTDQEKKSKAFSDILQETPDAKVVVHRQLNGGNSKMEYIDEFPADKYEVSELYRYLAHEFGGGDYRVKMYESGKLKANTLLSIADRNSSNKNAEVPAGGDNNTAILVNAMQENQRQMMAMINEQKNEKPKSSMETLQELQIMSKMFQPAPQPTMVDQMGAMVQMMSLIKQLNGEAPEEKEVDSTGKILELGANLVGAALQAKGAQPQQPQQPQQTQHETGDDDMNLKAKMGVNMLIGAADQGSEPAEYVQFILDNVDEVTLDSFFGAPDAIDQLIVKFPKIADHREWFTNLGELVKNA